MSTKKKGLASQITLTCGHKWKDDKKSILMQANDSITKEVKGHKKNEQKGENKYNQPFNIRNFWNVALHKMVLKVVVTFIWGTTQSTWTSKATQIS